MILLHCPLTSNIHRRVVVIYFSPLRPPQFHRSALKFRSTSYSSSSRSLKLSTAFLLKADPVETISNAESEGDTDLLPAVRSYENDLSRLDLVGSVGFGQAITAAAVDGGSAAEEHLSSGMQDMVIETFYPGRNGDHSTVSTRLFLPAKKVKEKAMKLKNRLGSDLFHSTAGSSVLARTFRQVVLQHMLSFKLVLYAPGVVRNMADLTNPEKIPTYFSVSSSDGRILATIAEVICAYALHCVEKEYLGETSYSIFGLFQKPLDIVSLDSSVSLSRLSKYEVIEEDKRRVKDFNFANRKSIERDRTFKYKWLKSASYYSQGKAEDSGFSHEYAPSYRILIDANKFKDVEFQGWKKSTDNKWEALFTHFQLVELANALDMFFEDRYTVPNKEFGCQWVSRSSNSLKKKTSSWKVFISALACGCVLISFGILARLYSPQILKDRNVFQKYTSVSQADTEPCQIQSLGVDELETFCVSIIEKIKNVHAGSADIMVDKSIGVWMGMLPDSLRKVHNTVANQIISRNGDADGGLPNYTQVHACTDPSVRENLGLEITSGQDICSYQVVLSIDGEIIGFQPTSRVAVNNWATNPLAKVLYKGKKISPGLVEPSVKIPQPSKIVLIELLMSANPDSWFVLARPCQ